jgi:hypothetical protein
MDVIKIIIVCVESSGIFVGIIALLMTYGIFQWVRQERMSILVEAKSMSTSPDDASLEELASSIQFGNQLAWGIRIELLILFLSIAALIYTLLH